MRSAASKSITPFYFLLFSLFCSLNSFAQTVPDTINQYNANHKKDGYWICYLDTNFNLTEKANAKYYGYEHYENGKNPIRNFTKAKWRKDYDIQYKSSSHIQDSNGLILIDGIVTFSENDTIYFYEVYKKGIPVMNTEYVFHEYGKDSSKIEPLESIYYDSLYNNQLESCLIYSYNNGLPFCKQYAGFPDRKRPEMVYLSPYTPYGPIHKPRIGYYYQQKSFLELGYSFKNTGGARDTLGGWHFDGDNFCGFTLSILGNFGKNNSYLGQKAVFSYYFYSLFVAEAGIVNYGDFKFTSNDTRATIGAGISLSGRFSIMYHYSIPLANSHFSEISRHSIGIMLF